MIDDQAGRSCDEAERAIARAAAVARAARSWEWWIIIGSMLYLAGHLANWCRNGFPVAI